MVKVNSRTVLQEVIICCLIRVIHYLENLTFLPLLPTSTVPLEHNITLTCTWDCEWLKKPKLKGHGTRVICECSHLRGTVVAYMPTETLVWTNTVSI